MVAHLVANEQQAQPGQQRWVGSGAGVATGVQPDQDSCSGGSRGCSMVALIVACHLAGCSSWEVAHPVS